MGQAMPSRHIMWLVPSSGLLTAQTSLSCRPLAASYCYSVLRLDPVSVTLEPRDRSMGFVVLRQVDM